MRLIMKTKTTSWLIISWLLILVLAADFIFLYLGNYLYLDNLYVITPFFSILTWELVGLLMVILEITVVALLIKPKGVRKTIGTIGFIILSLPMLVNLLKGFQNGWFEQIFYSLIYLLIFIFSIISLFRRDDKSSINKIFFIIIVVYLVVLNGYFLLFTVYFSFINSFGFPSIYHAIVEQLFILYIGFVFLAYSKLGPIPNKAKMDSSIKNGKKNELGYVGIGTALVLSFITVGVYFFIWIYHINKTMKQLSKTDSLPGSSFLAFLFIPFYSIYWAYSMGSHMNKLTSSKNQPYENKSTTYLLLSIFGLIVISAALIQSEINILIVDKQSMIQEETTLTTETNQEDDDLSKTNTKSVPTNGIELLKELSELRKNGIISEAEFQEKKREILKRI